MRDPFGWPRGPFPVRLGAPALDLNFLTGAMPAGLTFTRASTATYIGSDGLLKTAAVDEPRFDYDPVTLACKGLLIEESRTNLLTYSSDFTAGSWIKSGAITGDATPAPSGAMTADFIGTNGSQAQVFQGATIASGVAVSGSVFLKAGALSVVEVVLLSSGNITPYARATFDLAVGEISVAVTTANGGTNASAKIENCGNGWFRCAVVATYPATTSAGIRINSSGTSGGFFAWGAQLEAGAFPSSYIPATTAAVTRAPDTCLMTGTNFSRWFNPLEGTIVAEFSTITNGLTNTGAAAYPRLFAFESSAAENMHVFVSGAGGSPIAFAVIDGGVDQSKLPIYGNTLGTGAVFRSVAAYKTNDFAHSLNGSAPATDTSGTLPVCDRLSIGNLMGADQISGHIRRIPYWPRRLSNARLQELST